jgi:putative oxygen-independent coproporphyrinogen III oxidase
MPGADAAAHYLRPGTLRLPKLPPLALYVHLPWCLAKCPYCDFNSHAVPREGVPVDRTVDALVADLEASLPLVWGRPVVSVFLGGGTPSLFPPEAIGRLLSAVRARLPLEPGAEITLEANPGTFERDRFRAFREAGVTRLSLGVQSFDDRALGALGRVHDGAQARAAAGEAAEVFETWNLDLMTGLPDQDEAGAVADTRTALGFAPPHVSLYQLTIEPNTVFAKYVPAGLPDADAQARLLDAAAEPLRAAGLDRYEVSAHAREGHRSIHNVNYWTFGDYLGIGAGAHGKLSFPHRVVRQARRREPQAWLAAALAGDAVAEAVEVERKALPFEFMLNALRLREGFPLGLFGERTGLPPSAIARPLEDAERRGLLVRTGDAVRPTPLGFDFLSDLQALFLP